jgi:hypothetical protein
MDVFSCHPSLQDALLSLVSLCQKYMSIQKQANLLSNLSIAPHTLIFTQKLKANFIHCEDTRFKQGLSEKLTGH